MKTSSVERLFGILLLMLEIMFLRNPLFCIESFGQSRKINFINFMTDLSCEEVLSFQSFQAFPKQSSSSLVQRETWCVRVVSSLVSRTLFVSKQRRTTPIQHLTTITSLKPWHRSPSSPPQSSCLGQQMPQSSLGVKSGSVDRCIIVTYPHHFLRGCVVPEPRQAKQLPPR